MAHLGMVVAAPVGFTDSQLFERTVDATYTSAVTYAFTVPTGITTVRATLIGAAGGVPAAGSGGNHPGGRGVLITLVAVTPADVLDLEIGGSSKLSGRLGGWPDGGDGGGSTGFQGYPGGGSTRLKRAGVLLAIAGGGGGPRLEGGGATWDVNTVGDGGGAGLSGDGADGSPAADGHYLSVAYQTGGRGGTQSAGGVSGGSITGITRATDGSSLQGGHGLGKSGGGGGGLFGGGGGALDTAAGALYGGGGGGSSWVDVSVCTATVFAVDPAFGHGEVLLEW